MDLSNKTIEVIYLNSIIMPPKSTVKFVLVEQISDSIRIEEKTFTIELNSFYQSQDDPNLLAEIYEKLSAI